MSTSTGTFDSFTISAKVSSPASTIHGRVARHRPHLGVPAAAEGTRFLVPQLSQLTSAEGIVADSYPILAQR
jgi:hypothetical protein